MLPLTDVLQHLLARQVKKPRPVPSFKDWTLEDFKIRVSLSPEPCAQEKLRE